MILEIKNLSKVFKNGKKSVTAVDDVSLSIAEGEAVGLLGPNGAGKTTIIKSIMGLLMPTSGSIKIAGFDPQRQSLAALKQVAAVLEGSRNIYWRMSPYENMKFFAGIHGVSFRREKQYFDHLIEIFKLTDKQNSEVRLLSQGMKQKVAICCALAKKTPLVFLDEPTLGLDVETSYELRDTLKDICAAERRTFVVSSHDMDVIQDVCKRIIIMNYGRIIADEKMDELLSVFKSRSYKLIVEGEPDEEMLAQLRSQFAQAEIKRAEHQFSIVIDLPEHKMLYSLLDLLKLYEANIETINQQEPDLEKAFLSLVRKERENGTAHNGARSGYTKAHN